MIARDLLLHPVRLRIIQALAGRPATPLELKDRLGDVAQATLYRHLTHLHDGGMVEVTDERRVRGGTERTYALVASATALGPDDVADASADEHVRYFATFLGSLLSDFAGYLGEHDSQGPDLGADGVSYRQVPLWLSDEELASLVTALRETIASAIANEPSPERRRRLLTTIVMPGGAS